MEEHTKKVDSYVFKLLSNLAIQTSNSIALEIYSSIKEGYRAGFFEKWEIEFHSPSFGRASLMSPKHIVPHECWFLLFDDSEKIVNRAEYDFYGAIYRTSIKLALRRINYYLRKTRKILASDKQRDALSMISYINENLKEFRGALQNFNDEDTVSLYFMFHELPSERYVENKKYVKNFKEKIFRKTTKTNVVKGSTVTSG